MLGVALVCNALWLALRAVLWTISVLIVLFLFVCIIIYAYFNLATMTNEDLARYLHEDE